MSFYECLQVGFAACIGCGVWDLVKAWHEAER